LAWLKESHGLKYLVTKMLSPRFDRIANLPFQEHPTTYLGGAKTCITMNLGLPIKIATGTMPSKWLIPPRNSALATSPRLPS